jgi:hypothetical protein
MAKSDTESAMISLRVNTQMHNALLAVAYSDLVSKMGSTMKPSDINLSEFLRAMIEDFVTDYADAAGGIGALLEEYNAAQISELESKLESARGTVAAIAENPPRRQRGRRREPATN